MQYIEAPHEVPIHNDKSIFLGGGISNCPDWQKHAAAFLFKKMDATPFTVVNPRRNNFDTAKASESELQIVWEYNYLRKTTINLFWFPKETVCPITLFELGSALERIKNSNLTVIIGAEKEYSRLLDLQCQSKLNGYYMPIYKNLDNALTVAACMMKG